MSSIFSLTMYPIPQITDFVFSFCMKQSDNTGIAVMGVGCAVSFLTLPLYIATERWHGIERNMQQKLKPGQERIKRAFHGDERYMITAAFYRENRYSPIMALRSSFGLFIQIPFFIAAYSCLSSLPALHGQRFLFIHDMGAQDTLFHAGSFPVNVLPIAMALISSIPSVIYTRGFSVKERLQPQVPALIFLVVLFQSSAGLVLHWTMNKVFPLVKNVFYKLAHPAKTLYTLLCMAATVFIIWLTAGHVLSKKRSVLLAATAAFVYLVPLYIRFFTFLVDGPLLFLKSNKNKRFILFFAGCMALCLLLGCAIPSLLIASSPMEFSGIDGYGFPLFFVCNTFLQAVGFCIVWPLLVYFLYRERTQTLLAFFFFCGMVGAVINTFIFRARYGNLFRLFVLNTAPSVASPFASVLCNSLVLSISVALSAFLLKKGFYSAARFLAAATATALPIFTGINLTTIRRGYAEYRPALTAGNIQPIFHFSKTGKNVLMTYLDAAQNDFVEPIFKESPDLHECFSGFKLHNNTVSLNMHTLMASPPCYGDCDYTPQAMNARSTETLVSKHNQAPLMLPRIFTEQASRYSATVTDPSWENGSRVPDLSIFEPYPAISAHTTENMYTAEWYKEQCSLMAAFKRTGEWLRFLQSNGVYVNTRILTVADHGSIDETPSCSSGFKLKKLNAARYRPLLMEKDFDATGQLSTGSTFMCNADVPTMLTGGLVENATPTFTGNPVSMEQKECGVLVNTYHIYMPHHNRSYYVFTCGRNDRWRVSTSVFDSDDWQQEDVQE
ncbi:MAG: YidC/Oxa1 family membrane protein insertase [Treponema sp.]|nr:YidC/Oxa1 family membrane protein insertase [Treponema sp.]